MPRILCPKCSMSFTDEGVSIGHEVKCPACSITFGLGLKYMVFSSDAEKAAYVQKFKKAMSDAVAPAVEAMKKDEESRRHSILEAADQVFDELVDRTTLYLLPGMDQQVEEDMTIARTRPSTRKHLLSVPLECIAQTVLAVLGTGLQKMLKQLVGFLLFEMPLPRIEFQTCSTHNGGCFIVLAGSSMMTLQAMNYHLLKYMQSATSKDKSSGEHLDNLLRLGWYFEIGRQDHFDKALAPFLRAISNRRPDEAEKQALVCSAMLSHHQIRFLTAHEIAHVALHELDIPGPDVSEMLGEVRFLSLNESYYEATEVNRQQAQELEADNLAADICLQRDQKRPEMANDYQRFVDQCRRPDIAKTFYERLLGGGSKQAFVQATELLMIYFTLMDLCRDEYLGAQLRKNPGFYAPDDFPTHPWPELRFRCLQDFFKKAGLIAPWTKALLPLTDRNRFWALNLKIVHELSEDLP